VWAGAARQTRLGNRSNREYEREKKRMTEDSSTKRAVEIFLQEAKASETRESVVNVRFISEHERKETEKKCERGR